MSIAKGDSFKVSPNPIIGHGILKELLSRKLSSLIIVIVSSLYCGGTKQSNLSDRDTLIATYALIDIAIGAS